MTSSGDRSRRHDGGDADFLEADHAADHVAGRTLEPALTVGLVDDVPEFLVVGRTGGPAGEGPAKRRRDLAEVPHQRRDRPDDRAPERPGGDHDPGAGEPHEQHRHDDEQEPGEHDPAGDGRGAEGEAVAGGEEAAERKQRRGDRRHDHR